MTRRIKVALWGSTQKFQIIDLDELGGATLGQNIYYQGKLLDPRDVLNQLGRGNTTVVAGGGGGGGTRPPVPGGGPRTTDDLDEGRYNFYFTPNRAIDAVGGALLDSDDIDFTYDSGAHTITAELKPTGVTAGTFGDGTHTLQVEVDDKGRIVSITVVPISGGGGAVWGAITGTLSDQTDLQAALDDKADRDADQTFRTRHGDTGGGDIFTRNTWHGPVAYEYWADETGTRIFGTGPDAFPATAWCFFLGSAPSGFGTDPLAIDLATGELNAPFMTSTTQSPGDNSTKVATTAYVDAAASGSSIASIRRITALRAY